MKKCCFLVLALLASLVIVTACNHSNEDKGGWQDIVTVHEAKAIIDQHKGDENFILLDVRSNAEFKEGYLTGHLEKDESKPDNDPYKYGGVIQHSIDDKDFDEWISKLDKEKRYLVYCRTDKRAGKAFGKLKALGFKKIQYIKGGYTEWAQNIRLVEHFPDKKALDVLIKGDKIKTSSTIKFDFEVTNLTFDPARKPKINVQVFHDSTEVAKETIDGSAEGKATYTFDATSKTKGSYRLVCKPEYKGNDGNPYESVEAYYYFEVADQDEAVTGTAADIVATLDEINRIKERFYNRNIYGYKVYNREKQVVTLESQKQTKPVLLILFSPKCGGCMVKAQDLIKYKLDNITVLPVVTSVEEATLADDVTFTEDKFNNEFKIGELVPTALYDAKDKIWGSRFRFDSTPMFILINTNGQIKDIVYGSNDFNITTLLDKMETIFGVPKFELK